MIHLCCHTSICSSIPSLTKPPLEALIRYSSGKRLLSYRLLLLHAKFLVILLPIDAITNVMDVTRCSLYACSMYAICIHVYVSMVETPLKYYRSLRVEHFTNTRVQWTNTTYTCVCTPHLYLFVLVLFPRFFGQMI